MDGCCFFEVGDDKELTKQERDVLREEIQGGLDSAQRRLSHTLVDGRLRVEPEGGHDSRASGTLSPLSPQQGLPTSLSPAPDASAILQQYSDMLVQMVQKQLATKK